MTQGRGPRRFREQRWLVDEALRVRDVEFSQPRLGEPVEIPTSAPSHP